jgi:hypothetical protein
MALTARPQCGRPCSIAVTRPIEPKVLLRLRLNHDRMMMDQNGMCAWCILGMIAGTIPVFLVIRTNPVLVVLIERADRYGAIIGDKPEELLSHVLSVVIPAQ